MHNQLNYHRIPEKKAYHLAEYHTEYFHNGQNLIEACSTID